MRSLKEGFVKKEIYVVDCPTHIRFGDPMYFERLRDKNLNVLVVDCKVPKNFVARVVLREQPIEACREKGWIP